MEFIQFIKNIFKRSLSLLISFAILCILLGGTMHMVNVKEIGKTLLSISPLYFFILSSSIALTFLVNSLRINIISKWTLGVAFPYSLAVKITWLSSFLSLSTPIAALGDIARAGLVKLMLKTSVRNALKISLLDRAFSLYCLILFTLLSSLITYSSLSRTHLLIAGAIIPAGSLMALFGILFIYPRIKMPQNRLLLFLKEVMINFLFLLKQPVFLFQQIAIAFLNIILYAFAFLILAHSMHFSFNVMNLILLSPLILIVNNLPFFYLGWGGREAIFIMLMPILAPNINSNTLIAASIFFGVVSMFVSFLGIFYLFSVYKQYRNALFTKFFAENIREGI